MNNAREQLIAGEELLFIDGLVSRIISMSSINRFQIRRDIEQLYVQSPEKAREHRKLFLDFCYDREVCRMVGARYWRLEKKDFASLRNLAFLYISELQ